MTSAAKPHLYIGIDPGNDCGFAVMLPSGKLVESGTWQHKPNKNELAAARWLKFAANLRAIVNKYKKNYKLFVTYEYAPHQKSKHTAHIYGGWLAMLDIAEAENRSVTWRRIGDGQWKQTLGLTGRAKKPVYIKEINRRYNKSFGNHKGLSGEDEAAAIGVVYGSIVLRTQLD